MEANEIVYDKKLKKQLLKVFSCMKTRCYNPKHLCYKNYGGRGIGICDEWLGENGFANFYVWAIKSGFTGEKKANGYNVQTIDRIDNDKGYSPDNCKWSDRFEQARNKATSIWVEFNGERDTLINFCRRLDLDYHAVFLRIYRRHWDIDKALSTPLYKDYSIEYNNKVWNLKGLSKEIGVSFYTLKKYYLKNDCDIYKAIEKIKEKGLCKQKVGEII